MAAGAFGCQPTTLVVPKRQRKSGALIYLEPLGAPRPVAGELYVTSLWRSESVVIKKCDLESRWSSNFFYLKQIVGFSKIHIYQQ